MALAWGPRTDAAGLISKTSRRSYPCMHGCAAAGNPCPHHPHACVWPLVLHRTAGGAGHRGGRAHPWAARAHAPAEIGAPRHWCPWCAGCWRLVHTHICLDMRLTLRVATLALTYGRDLSWMRCVHGVASPSGPGIPVPMQPRAALLPAAPLPRRPPPACAMRCKIPPTSNTPPPCSIMCRTPPLCNPARLSDSHAYTLCPCAHCCRPPIRF